jgi:hypothetical protein
MIRRALLSVLSAGLLLGGVSRAGAVGKGQQTKVPSQEEKDLVKVCQETFKLIMNQIKAGKQVPEFSIWSRRWLQAELPLCRKQAEKIAAYKTHLDRTKEVERIAKLQYDIGRMSAVEYSTAKYYRLQAEVWVARAQAKK